MKNLKEFLLNIDRDNILYLLWCIILGIVGWFFHNPKLDQPLWAWIVGSIFANSVILILLIILASMTTSIFIKDYDDVLKQIAQYGYKENRNSKLGEKVNLVILSVFYSLVIFVMFCVVRNN